MKELLSNLNKAFENRIRLGIMSVLMVSERIDYIDLRETLDVTDGNLASHLRTLEDQGYISIKKRFVKRKPKTTYSLTVEGRIAFRKHLDALEELLNNK